MANCVLCDTDGGELLLAAADYRVVLVDEPGYPGYCRVIWQQHLPEMTDLTVAQRNTLMEVVWRVEQVLRDVLSPDKINLASFGNMTPHLHWHIIPRFADDAHFPEPTWGVRQREADSGKLAARIALLPQLRSALRANLHTWTRTS